jgi:hypothetical protein
LHVLVTAQFVETRYHKIVLQKPVARVGGFELVVGENLEREMETVIELILPLLGQTPGAYNQTALKVATGYQLPDEKASHDGLPGTGIICQKKPQGLARQHLSIHRRDLVWQRLND